MPRVIPRGLRFQARRLREILALEQPAHIHQIIIRSLWLNQTTVSKALQNAQGSSLGKKCIPLNSENPSILCASTISCSRRSTGTPVLTSPYLQPFISILKGSSTSSPTPLSLTNLPPLASATTLCSSIPTSSLSLPAPPPSSTSTHQLLHYVRPCHSPPQTNQRSLVVNQALVLLALGAAALGAVSTAEARAFKDPATNEPEGGHWGGRGGVDEAAPGFVAGQEVMPPQGGTSEPKANKHTARWRVYTDLGRELFSQGRWEEAERSFVQALQESRLGFGEDDPHVASSLNNLAELYRIRGKYQEAEPLFQESVHRLQKAYGPDYPGVGLALHNLGGLYLLQGKLEEAANTYANAASVKARSLGESHPEYANTLYHIGEVFRQQGELEKAEAFMMRALNILESGSGGNSLPVLRRKGRVAELLVRRGKVAEAEEMQRSVLKELQVLQGPEATTTAAALEALARTLHMRGNSEEAFLLLQKALRIRGAHAARAPEPLVALRVLLGKVVLELADRQRLQGHEKDALTLLEAAVVGLREAVRVGEQTFLRALARLALDRSQEEVLKAVGDAPGAEGEGEGEVAAPGEGAVGERAARGGVAGAFGEGVMELKIRREVEALKPQLATLVQAGSGLSDVLLRMAEFESLPKEQRASCLKEAEDVLRKSLALFMKAQIPETVLLAPTVLPTEAAACMRLANLLQHRREGQVAPSDSPVGPAPGSEEALLRERAARLESK